MEQLRVLITVKTYPTPSRTHDEIVCTAGVREDGSFVRLYPVPYRYLEDSQMYPKYQWVTVEGERHRNDQRPESYRPALDTLRLEGAPIGTSDGWRERQRWVLKQPAPSIEHLEERRQADNTSLGVFRPERIEDMVIKPTSREWSSEQRAILEQHRLFEPERKPLDKIPFDFVYRFHCPDERCRGHEMAIQDWEVGMLYRHELRRTGDPEAAAHGVRAKFLTELCSPARDTWFFVGTHSRYPVWMVIGVFWPPRTAQTSLDL